ncbi:DUF4124 domain-containing protein [Viridibacterium curvum]|uniref:DUF4124 domain-containing protein n=1 Tax=Viridibacterium curvum TaxID=1101404 RepID=A0ABP9QZF7_9RHOO
MKSSKLLVLLASLSVAPMALADIYKCVDDHQRVTYKNEKPAPGEKGCSIMTRDVPVNTVPAQKRAGAASSPPGNFPKVDGNTQRERDNDRRKILEQELASEQKLLAEAEKALAEGEAERRGDERNYAKYLERVSALRDTVKQHQSNIDKLKAELAKR